MLDILIEFILLLDLSLLLVVSITLIIDEAFGLTRTLIDFINRKRR